MELDNHTTLNEIGLLLTLINANKSKNILIIYSEMDKILLKLILFVFWSGYGNYTA